MKSKWQYHLLILKDIYLVCGMPKAKGWDFYYTELLVFYAQYSTHQHPKFISATIPGTAVIEHDVLTIANKCISCDEAGRKRGTEQMLEEEAELMREDNMVAKRKRIDAADQRTLADAAEAAERERKKEAKAAAKHQKKAKEVEHKRRQIAAAECERITAAERERITAAERERITAAECERITAAECERITAAECERIAAAECKSKKEDLKLVKEAQRKCERSARRKHKNKEAAARLLAGDPEYRRKHEEAVRLKRKEESRIRRKKEAKLKHEQDEKSKCKWIIDFERHQLALAALDGEFAVQSVAPLMQFAPDPDISAIVWRQLDTVVVSANAGLRSKRVLFVNARSQGLGAVLDIIKQRIGIGCGPDIIGIADCHFDWSATIDGCAYQLQLLFVYLPPFRDEVTDEAMGELLGVVKSCTLPVVAVGDFNAHFGKTISGSKRTARGGSLEELIAGRKLAIMNKALLNAPIPTYVKAIKTKPFKTKPFKTKPKTL
ncbi:hypothetical protein GGI21_004469, partial [Coemansia aciculifera]